MQHRQEAGCQQRARHRSCSAEVLQLAASLPSVCCLSVGPADGPTQLCAVQVARPGAKIGCSIVEAFSKDVRPRELEEVLRLEYRSKLLNPK